MTREIIAILHGVKPKELERNDVVLIERGTRTIDVTLQSPDSFNNISNPAIRIGPISQIGVSTVLDVADAAQIADIGDQIIVSRNTTPNII